MRTLAKIVNETTGAEKRIIETRKGFFVVWRRPGQEAETSEPMETLIEAQTAACFDSKAEAEAIEAKA